MTAFHFGKSNLLSWIASAGHRCPVDHFRGVKMAENEGTVFLDDPRASVEGVRYTLNKHLAGSERCESPKVLSPSLRVAKEVQLEKITIDTPTKRKAQSAINRQFREGNWENGAILEENDHDPSRYTADRFQREGTRTQGSETVKTMALDRSQTGHPIASTLMFEPKAQSDNTYSGGKPGKQRNCPLEAGMRSKMNKKKRKEEPGRQKKKARNWRSRESHLFLFNPPLQQYNILQRQEGLGDW
ncbi:hypothetical protein C8J56DRAFT_900564 [Mycena floridula]|nr:hypothetical protein C8J56DRAFT_900564 [Mycena floridula]